MSKTSCLLEQEVLKGLTSGNLEPGLRKHAGNCPVCKETAAIHGWMNRFRAVSMETKGAEIRLPDAEAIWEKASVRRAFQPKKVDKELEKKALWPLLIPQVLTVAAACVVIIYLVFFNISPGSLTIFTSIAAMFKSIFKSFSSMAVPMGIAMVPITIFTVVSGIQQKRDLAAGK
ncbi:MAG: hypothetical protein GY950_18685 [bacterium]|nr:hypothetical protein [bacterium]